MLERGAVIFLCAHSQYRGVFIGIAKRLRADLAAQIHLYTATREEASYYRRTYPDLFASISAASALYAACRESVVDAEATIEEARRNEREMGVTINQLAVSDRHLGRGFALGGFNHPRSRISEETTYLQMVSGFNAVIAFWADELDTKKPDLILNAPKVLCVLARKRGTPVRMLAGARYKTYYYWAVNEYLESPAIEAAFKQSEPNAELDLSAPYESHLRFRAHFRQQASIFRTFKAIAVSIVRHAYWVIRGYEKAKGYYLLENVSYLWRRRKDIATMTRSALPDLEQFQDAPFAFFPLATEPETALQTLSPEYLYQMSAIASVARDLPAGTQLAVKEHYAAAGRRPADFYDQIEDLKNVRMMNMAELGIDVVRKSLAVVTISGSSGFEGAVMGKPVITFGRHNLYNFLAHVMVVTDETQLKGYLETALGEAFDRERASVDGQRFLQAVVDASFDLMDFQPIKPDAISDHAVDSSYAALLDSIGATERRSLTPARN